MILPRQEVGTKTGSVRKSQPGWQQGVPAEEGGVGELVRLWPPWVTDTAVLTA